MATLITLGEDYEDCEPSEHEEVKVQDIKCNIRASCHSMSMLTINYSEMNFEKSTE